VDSSASTVDSSASVVRKGSRSYLPSEPAVTARPQMRIALCQGADLVFLS
jgi:hypothetical protein